MKLKEANKVISEFMGTGVKTIYTHNLEDYSGSLDALVLVWEELGVMPSLFKSRGNKYKATLETKDEFITSNPKIGLYGEYSSIQEAACIATAKLINGL